VMKTPISSPTTSTIKASDPRLLTKLSDDMCCQSPFARGTTRLKSVRLRRIETILRVHGMQ